MDRSHDPNFPVAISVSIAATVATPILADSSFIALFVARMFMGAAEVYYFSQS